MNIRKPSDYSSLYSALYGCPDGCNLAEMGLYCGNRQGRMRQNGEGRSSSGQLNTSSRDTRSERAFHPVIYAVCGCFI